MSRVEAAAASDRLPWLSDEPQQKPVKRSGGGTALGWAAAAIVVVAGAGFWMGSRSVEEQPPSAARRAPSTIVKLPEIRPTQPEVRISPQPEIRSAPIPEIRQAPAPEVRIVQPKPKSAPPEALTQPAPAEETVQQPSRDQLKQSAPAPVQAPAPAQAAIRPQPQFVLPKPWNPRVVAGAAGRLVQVGAFGSTYQAKRGWWFMVRAYPAMAHLPAVVRISRNSREHAFYRFQVGTTSQAHSEILCQRMQRIHLSCAVIGLPWKAKVER
jgi:hypothetical protein